MRRHGHGKRQGAFGTGFFGRLHGAFHRRGIAGNHHLPHGIEIHGFAHFALFGGGAHLADHIIVQTQNCRHRAHALRHGGLHQFGTAAHQTHRIGKVQAACGHQRGVFAQAVPCRHIGRFAACRQISAVSRHARRQHQGLRIDGLADEFGIFTVHHRPQILTQCVRGFGKGVAHRRNAVKTAHHVQALRALSGEEKCKWHG